MAAPHVAAVAAHLGTLYSASTPQQIETLARGKMYALGSVAEDNAPISTLNLTGARPKAIPTVVLALESDTKDRTGADSLKFRQPINLRYESVGASNCSVTGYNNGAVWYQYQNFGTSYNWGTSKLDDGNYQWLIDCVNANGAHNTATIKATVLPEPPTESFYINNVAQANGSVSNLYASAWPNGVNFRYLSTRAANCDVSVDSGPLGGPLIRWYDDYQKGAVFNWGNVMWGANATYKYSLRCYTSFGTESKTTVTINVRP
jgi:hypothetical protein